MGGNHVSQKVNLVAGIEPGKTIYTRNQVSTQGLQRRYNPEEEQAPDSKMHKHIILCSKKHL